MKLFKVFLLFIVVYNLPYHSVIGQENGFSTAIAYFEFMDANFKEKGSLKDTSHYILYTKDGDKSIKHIYMDSQGAYELSSVTYNNKGEICGFQTGELFIPTVKEDTLYRSKKKYFIIQDSIKPISISYSSDNINENIKIQKISYKSGVLFIFTDCPVGNLSLTNIQLTKTLSKKLPGDIMLEIKTPGVFFIGSFKIINPPLKAISDRYYIWEKEPIRIDRCIKPDEKDILLFLKAKQKMGKWESSGLKRLAELN